VKWYISKKKYTVSFKQYHVSAKCQQVQKALSLKLHKPACHHVSAYIHEALKQPKYLAMLPFHHQQITTI
jgi:hypothetical protein